MSWYNDISGGSEARSGRYISHVWGDMALVLKDLEPRFSLADQGFNFDFLGEIDSQSFNRIRATPDEDNEWITVYLQYTHADSAYISPVMETEFPFRPWDLSGDAKVDARLYATRLQMVLQALIEEKNSFKGNFQEQLEAAFSIPPGTEKPLLGFMDRFAAVQTAHRRVVTDRIIQLSAHLR